MKIWYSPFVGPLEPWLLKLMRLKLQILLLRLRILVLRWIICSGVISLCDTVRNTHLILLLDSVDLVCLELSHKLCRIRLPAAFVASDHIGLPCAHSCLSYLTIDVGTLNDDCGTVLMKVTENKGNEEQDGSGGVEEVRTRSMYSDHQWICRKGLAPVCSLIFISMYMGTLFSANSNLHNFSTDTLTAVTLPYSIPRNGSESHLDLWGGFDMGLTILL